MANNNENERPLTPAAWAYKAEMILGGRVEWRSRVQKYALYDWADVSVGPRVSGSYPYKGRYLRFQRLCTEEELISELVEKRMKDANQPSQ